jgi:hypothetical protein
MKSLKKLAMWLTVLAVCVMDGSPVFAKDSRMVKLYHSLEVNGTQIAPGEYQVSWEAQGSGTIVTFAKGKKVIATAPARVVDGSQKFSTNRVDFVEDEKGTAKLIEIRFGGTNQSLVFNQ